MRKLRLELDELTVESFMPYEAAVRLGTVHARQEYSDGVWSNCIEDCPYSGGETGLCGCNTADFWCGSEDCPNTGMHECDHYSKINPEACPAETGKMCTANGCWSGLC